MTRQRTHSSRVLTPLYAVLGATELAVEKLADLGANATGHRADDQPESRVAQAGRVITGARQVPALAINQAIDTVVRTQEHYAGLAERGQRLAGRQAPVQQTGDLLRQAGEKVARGRDAAADAAQRTRSAASETVQAARGSAEDVVEAVTHPTRLGSVARPPRLVRPLQRTRATDSAEGTGTVSPATGESVRAKPRRPRVNAAAGRSTTSPTRSDESSRSRSGVPAGSGVEAGATMPTKRPSSKTSSSKTSSSKTSSAKTASGKTSSSTTKSTMKSAAKTATGTGADTTSAPSVPSAPSASSSATSPASTGTARKRPRRAAPVSAAATADATAARTKPAATKAATSAPVTPASTPSTASTTEQA